MKAGKENKPSSSLQKSQHKTTVIDKENQPLNPKGKTNQHQAKPLPQKTGLKIRSRIQTI